MGHKAFRCVWVILTTWFCGVFWSCLLGIFSLVHFGPGRFVGLPGRSKRHRRRKRIKGAGSQAAGRSGAQSRFIAIASLVHGRDQTFWSKCQSGFLASLWHPWLILRFGYAIAHTSAFSDFFHIPSHAVLGPLLRVCSFSHLVFDLCHVLCLAWLLRRPSLPQTFAVARVSWMGRSLFLCFPCIIAHPRMSVVLWTRVFLTCAFCPFSSYPGCSTHSHQPGWHNLKDRA